MRRSALPIATSIAMILAAASFPAAAQDAPSRRALRPAPEPAMIPCPEHGPGFMRLPGSTTCVKVSGQVRGEIGVQGRRSRLGDEALPARRAEARLTTETRTGTDYGQIRAVLSLRGNAGSGRIDSSP
jgi:hypothetical protein